MRGGNDARGVRRSFSERILLILCGVGEGSGDCKRVRTGFFAALEREAAIVITGSEGILCGIGEASSDRKRVRIKGFFAALEREAAIVNGFGLRDSSRR